MPRITRSTTRGQLTCNLDTKTHQENIDPVLDQQSHSARKVNVKTAKTKNKPKNNSSKGSKINKEKTVLQIKNETEFNETCSVPDNSTSSSDKFSGTKSRKRKLSVSHKTCDKDTANKSHYFETDKLISPKLVLYNCEVSKHTQEQKNQSSIITTGFNESFSEQGLSDDKSLSDKRLLNDKELSDDKGLSDEEHLSDDDEEHDDWEEVKEESVAQESIIDLKSQIPKEAVEITLEQDSINKKKRKSVDMETYIRRHFNRLNKEIQENMHKVHVIGLMCYGMYINRLSHTPLLLASSLSLVPVDLDLKPQLVDPQLLTRFVKWFRGKFLFQPDSQKFSCISVKSLLDQLLKSCILNVPSLIMLMNSILVSVGIKSRIAYSLQPMTFKVLTQDIASKSTADSSDKKKIDKESSQAKSKKTVGKTSRCSSAYFTGSDDADEDFVLSPKTQEKLKKIKTKNKKLKLTQNPETNEFSLDSKSFQKDIEQDLWLEVYSPKAAKWICVDCVNQKVDEPHLIEKRIKQPLSYIFAFEKYSYVKDVTVRYSSEFSTKTRKLRLDEKWLEQLLAPLRNPNQKMEEEENQFLQSNLLSRPLPTTISEYKNHPQYVLKRHLLKFEALYPPSAVPVGFIKEEPVYSRDCVFTLHCRESWIREARVVKLNEKPYKLVKARPKRNKTEVPLLEVFGMWQTEDYVPLPVVDGKIPRNQYGNVELFKPSMLPAGTVHLKLPGLNKVAKKLNVDAVQAVVGWDFHGCSNHPVMDGWVVCEEHKDLLIAAWDEEQEIIKERQALKREQRIYKNWRLIIESLLVRQRLKNTFNLPTIKEKMNEDEKNKKETTSQAWNNKIHETLKKGKSGKKKSTPFPFEEL